VVAAARAEVSAVAKICVELFVEQNLELIGVWRLVFVAGSTRWPKTISAKSSKLS
jgi:hypothetical protein